MARRTAWLVATGVFTMLVVIWVVPELQYPPLSDAELRQVTATDTRIGLQQTQGQLRNGARSSLLQAFAGLLVVLGATATWYQVRVNRDGQITDRYSRAIEHLGSDNVDVRIGGLYVLERIANNSAEDRRFVQVTIGSFLRNRAPWAGPEHPTPVVDESVPWLRMRAPDVQTALVILARRPIARDAPPVQLSRVDLRSVDLENQRLTDMKFRRSNLARARLRGAWLDGCDFSASDLRKADLKGASLRKASLRNAYLEGADLRGADLEGVDLRGAHADATTVWPPEFTPEVRRARGVVDSAASPPSD